MNIYFWIILGGVPIFLLVSVVVTTSIVFRRLSKKISKEISKEINEVNQKFEAEKKNNEKLISALKKDERLISALTAMIDAQNEQLDAMKKALF